MGVEWDATKKGKSEQRDEGGDFGLVEKRGGAFRAGVGKGGSED